MELKINFDIALTLCLEGVDLFLSFVIIPGKVGVNGKQLRKCLEGKAKKYNKDLFVDVYFVNHYLLLI